MTQVRYSAYLRMWLLTALLVIGAITTINLVVDPYGVYGLIRIEGFNSVKVRAQQRGWLSKSHNLARVGPRSLILGNSRAEVGFDPSHPGWPADGRPAYNYALPGVGLSASLDQLDYALRTAPIRTVVLGLDFRDFTFDASRVKPQTRKEPVHNADDGQPREWVRRMGDLADTLLSLGALGDSMRTVLGQRNRFATRITELGFNPLLDYIPIAREIGYRAIFDQKNSEYARAFTREGKDVFVPGSQESPEFDTLRAFLARCRKAGVRLHIVVYPYHAHIQELFRSAGLWNSFEDWKRKVTQIVNDDAAAAGPASQFPLWDFSGYSPFATEEVAAPGDLRSEMRWYWEGGHFKKELGDLALDKVLGHGDPRRVVEGEFGTLLTAANLEAHLASIRAQRERYATSHQKDLAYLARLVEAAKRPTIKQSDSAEPQ